MKKVNEVHEGIQTYGVKSTSELSLICALGVPENAARELLTQAGNSIKGIAQMSIQALTEINGITKTKATIIQAAIEIGRRRQTEQAEIKKAITSSLDSFDILHPLMQDTPQEHFYIILLDRRNKILRTECIHIGGMSAMVVDPKIIFQKALQFKACSIILSHNHPSGAPDPSMEDIRLTERIKSAGQFLDIKVLDHIVIGDGRYYSFADEGRM